MFVRFALWWIFVSYLFYGLNDCFVDLAIGLRVGVMLAWVLVLGFAVQFALGLLGFFLFCTW